MRHPVPAILALGFLAQCAFDEGRSRCGPEGLEKPIILTLVQRTRKTIHPLGEDISIGIGDITGGQVLVDLQRGKKPLLDTTSMAPGDWKPFPWAGGTLYLQLKILRNFLVGDDFGIFMITSREPRAEEADTADHPTNPRWAQPVQVEGVPNLHKLTDTLYRSGQPTGEGMKNLERLGIRTVVNLRILHGDEKEMETTGLACERIPMQARRPEKKDLLRFLRVVSARERAPFLVHGRQGSHRTGLVCALYRVALQGWSKKEAIAEMRQGGYGFGRSWPNLVIYLRNLDIEELKSQAGIE